MTKKFLVVSLIGLFSCLSAEAYAGAINFDFMEFSASANAYHSIGGIDIDSQTTSIPPASARAVVTGGGTQGGAEGRAYAGLNSVTASADAEALGRNTSADASASAQSILRFTATFPQLSLTFYTFNQLGFPLSQIGASLYDETTATYLFSYDEKTIPAGDWEFDQKINLFPGNHYTLKFSAHEEASGATFGIIDIYHIEISAVPLPPSLLMLSSGLLGMLLIQRKKGGRVGLGICS